MRKPPKNTRGLEPVAAIDIGGSKVACVIANLASSHDAAAAFDGPYSSRAEEIDVLGLGQHGAVAFDRNTDMEKAIRAAVEAAERMAGVRVQSVYVGARGRSIGCRRVGVDLDVAGGYVTADDVHDCLEAGAKAAASDVSRPLHALPMRFLVDGEPVHDAPEGMVGDVLTAEVLGLSVRDSFVTNIESLMARCALDLEEVVAAPYAAAEAVILEDEKDLGAIVLDIGARATDFALYDRGALVACGAVALGGEHITRDIAQIFGAPIAKAERIKTLYGSALMTEGDEHRLVDFPQLGAPGETVRRPRSELAAVVSSRLEEIFEVALDALPAKGASKRSVKRALLTGGGSLIVGARETAERVIGVKTRLGRPLTLAGAPEAATAPQFAAAIGMLQYAARRKHMPRRTHGDAWIFSDGLQNFRAPKLIGRVGSWLKAHF